MRSLKLMECTPVGWSTPAANGLKKLYKENKSQIVPPYNQGGWLGLYHHQGIQNKHFPDAQCTPKLLAYSLQITWFIIIHNCTVHLHWLLPCLWLYWHNILVLHQNSDVHKHSLPAEPQTWGLLQACFPSMKGCDIQVIMTLSTHWVWVTVTGDYRSQWP